jgi:fibronectin type 3 domain-containing protein
MKFVPLTICAVLLAATVVPARSFTHPCIPSSVQDLDAIKANLDKEPWKTGFAILAGGSPLDYKMRGPFSEVTRNPNLHLAEWAGDMSMVYNFARMWYFTGNNAYAQKAHDILIAWANTQTIMGGNQAGLALGDLAIAYGGGSSILRGTWPGWTDADTATVKNYFLNVLWPACAASVQVVGPANKGDINLMSGIAIAAFCDDTEKFNFIINTYRTYPGAGLPNILPTGEMGETGRDAGHAYGGLLGKAFVAEVAWQQGIDLFSEGDNRLLACAEYYCRNIFETDNPFVPYGTVDALYVNNAEGPYGANRAALNIIQNAYKNRKGIPTPWIDRKLPEQIVDNYNWMFAKSSDFSTAAPPAANVPPPVSLASSGLTLTTLGNNSSGRSVSYANGVWTMTGAGTDVSGDVNDDCQFAYKQMTGDCAIVARVTSVQSISGATKAGVMIRDTLSAPVSQRTYVDIIPNATPQMQSREAGATLIWAGRREQTYSLPSPGMPYWVKVERRGTLLTTYSSQDGTSWLPIVSSEFANLPSTLYIGLFTVSGSATTTTTATFDNVAFTGGTGGLVTTPAAPAAVLATGSNKSITVRWLPSFGATAYDVLRSTTSGSGYTVIASNLPADKTSYVDTAPAAGTTYYYVVQAKNSAGTSGNSPQFYGFLLPTAMVDLAFGGTATDSAHSSGGDGPKAFDGNPGSKWFNNAAAPTGWLQYDFGAGNAQVVKRYTISVADVANRDPKDWTFLGSQDGTNWTTLDSQSGQIFANRTQRNTYPIANTTAYRYYRLNVTTNNGGDAVAVADLGLWSDTGRTIPDGTFIITSRNSSKLMDVTGNTNGAQAVQQSFAGDDTQQWTLAWQGNGVYRATNVAAAKVLDNGGTSTAGANLVIQPSSAATSQLWKFTPAADGFLRIDSSNSGLVASVSGASTANGANIIQSTYSGSNSQQWMPSVAPAPQPTPAAPTGVSASPDSISQITLSWTASPGAVHYVIKRATVSGGPYTTVTTEATGTSYSDTFLNSGVKYYYVVSATNGNGEGANSAQASATTLIGPPSAPTGLTTIPGTSQVTLNWTAAGGATSYIVKRSATIGGPYTTIATGVTSPTYTDTSITSGLAYYYIVIAVNASGSSSNSAEGVLGANNLSVHLKFNETGGVVAADSSGGAHDAKLLNSPAFAAGILGNAVVFPATASQCAKLPSGIASGLTDFTIATWVKVKTFATWQRIFDFGSDTNTTMFLSAQGSAGAGRPRFSIRTSTIAEQVIDSSVALTAGAWAHIAVTRSGNAVSIYINGSLAGSGTITASPADMGITTQNYLGKSQFSDPYLNAALDDFRLYTRALSAAEITALARPPAGAPTQLAAVSGDTQATLTWIPDGTTAHTIKRATTSGGPYVTVANNVTDTTYTDIGLTNDVTYYYVVSGANSGGSGPNSTEVAATPVSSLSVRLKFDETSGTVAADSSGHARNATLVNGPQFGPGWANNGLTFTASSSQYATLPAASIQGLTGVTIMAWVKPTTVAQFSRIFDFGSNTTSYMFLSTNVGNVLRFAITNSGSGGEQKISGTATLPIGVWSHVAVTLDGSVGRLYVNGIQVGENTNLTLTPASLGTLTNLYLGKSQFAADPYLNGTLDDFRIYGQAFRASDITDFVIQQLGVPQNVSATPGSTQITLAWDAVSGATGYTINRSVNVDGPYSLLAESATPGYVDTGLQNAEKWYYTIAAKKDSLVGASSTPVSVTTYTPLEGWRFTAFGSSASNPNNAITKPNATQDVPYTGQTLAIDVSGATFRYEKVSGPAWLSVASNGALTGTPGNGDVGANTFVIRVKDMDSGATDDVQLKITVENVNDAPTWNASPFALRQVSVGWAYTGQTLAGRASDIDAPYGDTLTFSKVSGPAWLSVAANGALSGTPGANDAGPNSFTVRVTDAGGLFANATVTIPVAAVGLRSRYDFEANLTDAVGGFNGTATGSPTYTTGRLGLGAVSLEGTTSSVKLPVNAASYEEITVAAFVYWNGGNQWQRVFDFGTGTTSYFYLTPRSGSNTTRCAIRLNNGTEYQVNTTQLATGQWVHLAVTLSANTLKLYVNGTLAGTTNNVPVRPVDIDPTLNYLGKSQFAADALFNGRIDDLRIYNRELTAAEVLDLATPVPETPSGLVASRTQSGAALTWNAAEGAVSYSVKRSGTPGGPYSTIASGLATPGFTDPNVSGLLTYYYVVSATNTKGESPNSNETATAVSDLVLHLRFDESSGTTAGDTSGNGRNATLVAGPTFAAGKLGNALGFVKASSQYATLPTGLVSTLTDFTISTWVKPTTLDTWARVFDFGTGTTNFMFLTTTNGGGKPRLTFKVNGAADQVVDSSVALTANAWSHVAVTLSGNTMTLYVNGTAVGTNTNVTARPSQLGNTTLNYLGKSQFAADPYFNGSLDDFRIYNRALSVSEIGVLSTAQIGVPQNVTATPGSTQITLAWNAVPGATAYTVQRSSSATGPFTVLARGVTTPTYTDTGLQNAAKWYYTITAEGLAGDGTASAVASATTYTPLEGWRFTAFGTSASNPNNTVTKPSATQDVAYTGQTVAISVSGASFTYSKVSGPAWLSVASNGTLSGTPGNGDVGANTFVVRVTDIGSGATDDVNLKITVVNVNDAPTWTASSFALRQVSVGWAYTGQTLAGRVSDIDTPYGDTLTYSKVSGPAWLTVAANGALSGTPGANDAGMNTFTVRVTDAGGLFADATMTIPVAAVGLRSRYDFEASLADAVGGFNGTATGSPTYGRGRLGLGAVSLEGTTSSVKLPVNAASYEEITVAAFVYWNGGNQSQRIFDFGTGTTSYFYLTPRSSTNTTQCAIRLNNGTEYTVSTTQLTSGQWVHLAVTLSANTLKLYVNGALAGTTANVPVRPVDIDPTLNYLGKSQTAADPLFNGRIDDLRIYNRALTVAEVLDLATPVPETPSGLVASRTQSGAALTWNAAEGAVSYSVKRSLNPGGPYTTIASSLATPGFTDPNVSSLLTYYYVVSATNTKGESPNSNEATTAVTDLMVHLRFDESSGTTAADTSGNGRDATLVNAPTFAAGKLGNALGLVKASSQHATLPTGLVSTLTNFTVSAWVKPTTLDTMARVFDFGTGTTNYLFLSTSTGAGKPRVAFKVNGAAEQGIDSSMALTAGAWSHVAVTLSGNTMTLYVNGSVAGTNTNVTARPSLLGNTTQNYLGKSQFAADPYLNGALDDFRIYSRALSASEIGVLSTAQISVPQNVTATSGSGQITLAWNAVSGATAYTVQRSSSASGPFTVLARGITTATYADTGLADATTWYYTVAAEGLPGESAASAAVSATTFTLLEKWRFANFGTASNTGAAADGADSDGDGLTNVLEYNAGTDPKSAASVLRVTLITVSGNNLLVNFPSVSGKTYRLERSSTLLSNSWTIVQDNIAGTGGILQITDTGAATQSKRFYRIVVP